MIDLNDELGAEAEKLMKSLCTPFIWTNADMRSPCEFVIIQGVPGDFHPTGVEVEFVSQLFVLSGP